MYRKQYTAKRSLTKGAAQARRLLAASQSPAKFVIASTTHLVPEQAARGPVQYRRATIEFKRGELTLAQGENFWLVESRCAPGHFYLLVERNGQWQCSCRDEKTLAMCAAKIEQYQAFQPAA